MKKLLTTIILLITTVFAQHAFAATGITATTSQTATSFTVNYHYVGTPTQTTKLYSWLTNTVTGAWVDRSNLLLTINSSTTEVTKDFSVTYDFTALGLTGNGTKYAYYLADGTTDSANLWYGAANFVVGVAATPTYTITATGQYAGQAAGMYQEGFSVKAGVAPTQNVNLSLKIFKNCSSTCTLVSTNPVPISAGSTDPVSPSSDDLGPGSYTANLYSGSDLVGKVDFTITSTVATFEMEVSSVMAPATTVTIVGTITATRTDVPNGHLVLKLGTSPSALTITKVAYNGDIPLTGTSFTVTSDSLDPASNLYYYKFTETTTGTDLASGSFALNTPTDQSNGPVSPNTNSNNTSGTNSNTALACATGPFTTTTPMSNLCASGTASNLVNTTSSWTWSCNNFPSNTSIACSAIVNSTQDGSNSSDPSNYLQNPLSKELNSFPKIFAAIMNNVIMPVMVIFLPMMLIYSGFLFVIARKKESVNGIENAKTTFKWTIIGAIIILGATVIANALQGTVTQIFGVGGTPQVAQSSSTTPPDTTSTSTPATTTTTNSVVKSAAAATTTSVTTNANSSNTATQNAATASTTSSKTTAGTTTTSTNNAKNSAAAGNTAATGVSAFINTISR